MNNLGLTAPSTIFDNINLAVANTGVLIETLTTLGIGATMGELIGSTKGLEKLRVIASLSASAYVGALVGSLAVASGRRMLGCGSRISDLFVFQNKNNLKFKNSHAFFVRNPEILDYENKSRPHYKTRIFKMNFS